MKKFTAKIFAGVFAVALMASSALAVSAADYSNDPDYGKPTAPAVEVKTEDVTAAITASADKTEVVIEVKEEDAGAKVDDDVIAAIKAQEKPVVFESTTYSVTIDPKDIKEDAKPIDLSMGITSVSEETKLSTKVTVPAGAVMIAPVAKGDFGMTVSVTVPAKNVDQKKAKLYYISDDGKVSDVSDALSFDKDGNAVIAISHASSYVISETEIKGAAAEEKPDDGKTPDTGVTLPIALVALAGGAVAVSAMVAKKRK